MIEMPDFLSNAQVERAHGRARELQRASMINGSYRARELCMKGMRMAADRNPRMLKFMEYAADYLHKRNDEQVIRFKQEGLDPAKAEFAEFAVWREAYLRAAEPQGREDVSLRVYGWYYGAVAEALGA